MNLFVISNNFSYQLAKSIIHTNDIEDSSELLLMRNIKGQKRCYSPIWHRTYADWSFLKKARHLYSLYRKIRDKTSGRRYRAFLSTGADTMSRFITRDRKCIAVCALEEGLGSYRQESRYTSEKKGYFLSRASSKPLADTYYAVCEDAFPGEDVVTVCLAAEPDEAVRKINNNWLVVVDDLLVTNVGLKKFLEVCLSKICEIDERGKVFASLHPSVNSKKNVNTVEDMGVSCVDTNIDIASKIAKTKYIGGVSSALLYNSFFGGVSYSVIDELKGISEKYSLIEKELPPVFFNKVKKA